jgi:SPP1 family predicted phage head-tail adaptor
MRRLISIGARRQRFILEQPVEAPDGTGGVTRSYQVLTPLWGSLEFISGAEQFQRDRMEQAITHRISLRYRADINAGMRLRLGARLFDIKTIADPDQRRRHLTCLAQEIVP